MSFFSCVALSSALNLGVSRELRFLDNEGAPLADILGTLPANLRELLRVLTSSAEFENITVRSTCNKDEPGIVYHFSIWGRYIMRVRMLCSISKLRGIFI